MSTVSDQPQAAIDTAARTVIAHKEILAATIADIATEAGRSTASFYNYDDFAQYWAEICAIPTSFITEMVRRAQSDGYSAGDDPQLIAVAIVAMLNQFCYLQLAGPGPGPVGDPDDEACITTLANIFYRAIYYKEGR